MIKHLRYDHSSTLRLWGFSRNQLSQKLQAHCENRLNQDANAEFEARYEQGIISKLSDKAPTWSTMAVSANCTY